MTLRGNMKLLAGTLLVGMLGLGVMQSAQAIPLAEQSEGQLVSQVTDDEGITRIPAEVMSVFGNDYMRVRLPDGETRVVPVPRAYETRRVIPGSDVILTMAGGRVTEVALATEEDILALQEEMEQQEEVVIVEERTEVVQTETQVEERQETRQEVTQRQPEVAPRPAPQPVRGLW